VANYFSGGFASLAGYDPDLNSEFTGSYKKVYTIPYIPNPNPCPDPDFPENSNRDPIPKNVAGLRICSDADPDPCPSLMLSEAYQLF